MVLGMNGGGAGLAKRPDVKLQQLCHTASMEKTPPGRSFWVQNEEVPSRVSTIETSSLCLYPESGPGVVKIGRFRGLVVVGGDS